MVVELSAVVEFDDEIGRDAAESERFLFLDQGELFKTEIPPVS